MGGGDNSRVANQSVSLGPRLRRALNDVLGGSAASVLTVTFGLSYSLLIFAGPLAPFLSYGVASTFISSAIVHPFRCAHVHNCTLAILHICSARAIRLWFL